VSEGWLVRLSRWRVDVAWLGVLVLPMAHPTARSILACLPLLGAGVALRVWARGHLERAQRVTQTGPYALARHPLYVGSFCIAIAFALIARVWFLPPLVAAIFLVMYVPKALREEAWLRRRFGTDYAEYARRVGAVFPYRLPSLSSLRSSFRWSRVIGHREWKTWAGVAAVLALMWVRALTAAPH
jgi:protein-S-isoprenylcysteine O-methyltransferase Ste14